MSSVVSASTHVTHLIGSQSTKTVLHNTSNIKISLVDTLQEDAPSQFSIYPSDAFIFVVEGQLFLRTTDEENSLKAHQGSWLYYQNACQIVMLSENAKYLVFELKKQFTDSQKQMTKVANGQAQKHKDKDGLLHWTLSESDFSRFEVLFFPPNYKSARHYFKNSAQYLFNLGQGRQSIELIGGQSEPMNIPDFGLFLNTKESLSFVNVKHASIPVLRVFTPPPKSGRVFVLKKSD
ncbi:hypothetical protein [Marinomonas balearica]|uniref:Quercetin 2,3-dioxygenase C-terminal cupin domain-containing protein n=1 Tax=Marinomonas balearica TaxID=491947 RepID=A0A4R6MDA9_9GAMM|nr:hypothetical protein [Marinomonas balearica]TDO99678.1 hypothetical protein DFP79_0665 [Marinomonas balearica]